MAVIKCQTKSCSKIIQDGEQKTIVAGDLEFTVCRKCYDMIVSFISNKGAMDQFMLRRNREQPATEPSGKTLVACDWCGDLYRENDLRLSEHQDGRVCNRCRADDSPDE